MLQTINLRSSVQGSRLATLSRSDLCANPLGLLAAKIRKATGCTHLADNVFVQILNNVAFFSVCLTVKATGCDDESHVA